MTAVVDVRGAHKTYRRFRKPAEHALRGLDLQIEQGGVFGFLGPNGSGKTTTLRLLLGLARADAGELRLLGHRVPQQLPAIIGQVGALVETPLFLPGFTGRRNLTLLAGAARIPASRVEETLEFVGLSGRADDRVRTYSLGMKQRLGIAAALLKDPALLILDEPANGLDPAGIVEVRELVQRLGGEGRTVFVSSHILSEIQHTADRVAIIARGRLVKEGLVREVLARGGAEGLIVRVEDLAAGVRALADAGIDSVADDGVLHVRVPATEASDVTRALAGRGIFLSELRPDELDLETVFLELTKDEGPGS
jgi:ABC-2 type transport system ATP-binding protein